MKAHTTYVVQHTCMYLCTAFVTLLCAIVLWPANAYAASLTASNPSAGAVVNPEGTTFTLTFSNNVAGNDAWAINQYCFTVVGQDGITYPCTVSRDYFGNTPGDTADAGNLRRVLYVSVSRLKPGASYTIFGNGMFTQGHTSIPAFSIPFSTCGEPEEPGSGSGGSGGTDSAPGDGDGSSDSGYAEGEGTGSETPDNTEPQGDADSGSSSDSGLSDMSDSSEASYASVTTASTVVEAFTQAAPPENTDEESSAESTKGSVGLGGTHVYSMQVPSPGIVAPTDSVLVVPVNPPLYMLLLLFVIVGFGVQIASWGIKRLK